MSLCGEGINHMDGQRICGKPVALKAGRQREPGEKSNGEQNVSEHFYVFVSFFYFFYFREHLFNFRVCVSVFVFPWAFFISVSIYLLVFYVWWGFCISVNIYLLVMCLREFLHFHEHLFNFREHMIVRTYVWVRFCISVSICLISVSILLLVLTLELVFVFPWAFV